MYVVQNAPLHTAGANREAGAEAPAFFTYLRIPSFSISEV